MRKSAKGNGTVYDTYLDLVHVADSVVEFDRSSFFDIRLLLRCRAIQSLHCCWCRRMRVARHGRVAGNCASWASWLATLLEWTVVIERSALTGPLRDAAVAGLGGCTELSLRALDAVLNRSLPVCRSLLFDKSWCRSRGGGGGGFDLYSCARTDRVNS